ncbi:MAG: flavin reductase family protein [Phycisphaerales bacterium]|nr:flavin reductase family protein [Planctomycetota bacterium]MCH8508403.1 flavin reductase family protein [Phycisphaerales bacterium]
MPEQPVNQNGASPISESGAPDIAGALRVFPESICLMTSAYDHDRAGVLVHGVLVASEVPPQIVVACRKGHAIDPVIRDARCFALGLVGPDDRLIQKRFRFADTAVSPKADPDADDPFDPFPDIRMPSGSPIIERCAVWLDCQVVRHFDLESEHELFVGQVTSARLRQ